MKEKKKIVTNIHINDERFRVDQDQMTSSQIKELARIPPENKLFLEESGPARRPANRGILEPSHQNSWVRQIVRH